MRHGGYHSATQSGLSILLETRSRQSASLISAPPTHLAEFRREVPLVFARRISQIPRHNGFVRAASPSVQRALFRRLALNYLRRLACVR